ncbi:hypothetical protein [Cohnella sp. AR92]|uniref:hypothetical protein n=1 Tax=Cohnella sp. AR92 TaxID=648716 RepID=UPI000F8E2CD1|nr:hypothetical protein [Cohnella sp. AR92]RUS44642.1 hypothetical protein ELR57_22935 [Cohnella sp. AR92]
MKSSRSVRARRGRSRIIKRGARRLTSSARGTSRARRRKASGSGTRTANLPAASAPGLAYNQVFDQAYDAGFNDGFAKGIQDGQAFVV